MTQTVVIMGGGVAGLSAAHELSERGFAVTVYERQPHAGGKAQSAWAKGTGTGGRRDLPGEHGFRFFPHFYRHLPDTLKRIPYPGNADGVHGNLVGTQRVITTEAGEVPISFPQRFPRTIGELHAMLTALVQSEAEFRDEDSQFLLARTWQLVTSCAERKLAEYEKIDWWTFIDAQARSAAYQRFADLPRMTVAADPRVSDTRTLGDIAFQMMLGLSQSRHSSDRVLNGPTNVAWIDPWVDHLRQRGVEFHFSAEVTELRCANGRIQSIGVREGGRVIDARGDYYLACVPVEMMAHLLRNDAYEERGATKYRNVLQADPGLAGILKLSRDVSWMHGLQFYLRQDIPMVPGHAMFLDSPWALTSISQHQFWPSLDLGQYGDGSVRGILSVDISEWNTCGRYCKKPARECTVGEIVEEVWAQLKDSINGPGGVVLRDEDRHSYYVDTDVEEDQVPGYLISQGEAYADSGSRMLQTGYNIYSQPLLINKPGTWPLRPGAFSQIPNLFLASDYVRTNTELATMEAANEAARRAVNAILAASGSRMPLCKIWPLHELAILAPWRWYDRWRFQRGLPWKGRLPFVVQLGHAAICTLGDIAWWMRGRRHAGR